VGNFFGWMGMREQQRVLLSSRDHMNKVVEVAEHLRSVLQHFCAGELDEANVYQQRIFNAERQADELRENCWRSCPKVCSCLPTARI
jgi:Phosphate transport regulator (distant homolog of PhoU)